MRTILLALLLISFNGYSQTQSVYIKLTDAAGKPINGTCTVRGYEKWIDVLTMGTAGKNNSQLTFTMPVGGAAADLKRALNQGEFLQNGQLVVTRITPDRPVMVYKISMEKMKVNTCTESMGCNSVITTTVTLSAARIGWTYFQQDKTGVTTVSNKYGFDNETGGSWTNF